jgi:hypothetical protein
MAQHTTEVQGLPFSVFPTLILKHLVGPPWVGVRPNLKKTARTQRIRRHICVALRQIGPTIPEQERVTQRGQYERQAFYTHVRVLNTERQYYS